MPIIENVVFTYVKVQRPVKKYQSEDLEFTVDTVVPKSVAKEWNKKYKKQPAKVVENEDFEGIYKIEVPFPDQDEQYIIKFKRDAQYKDGTPIAEEARPRVFVKQENGKLKDITKDVLVANGSVGVVQYTESTNDFGTFAHLKAIRVDDLIAYEGNGFSELGEVEELATGLDTTVNEAASSNELGDIEEGDQSSQEGQDDVPTPAPTPRRGRPAKVAPNASKGAPF